MWHHLKKSLKDIHFTRIESKTINGIPDLFGIYQGISFWCELKASESKHPRLSKWQISWMNNYVIRGGVYLICNLALSQRELKLYRIQSWVEDPRLLVPDAVVQKNEKDLQIKFTSLLRLPITRRLSETTAFPSPGLPVNGPRLRDNCKIDSD